MTADPRARARLAADPGRHGESPIKSVAGDLLPLGIAAILHNNADIAPPAYQPRKHRECPSCFGRGVGALLRGGGNAACSQCQGFGTVAL